LVWISRRVAPPAVLERRVPACDEEAVQHSGGFDMDNKHIQEFRQKEYEQLKQEILRNQDFVSSFVVFGLGFCLAFIAAIASDKLDISVRKMGAGFLPFLAFIICSLVLRKLNRTYFIGNYIRFAIEPDAGIRWEQFAGEYGNRVLFGTSGMADLILSKLKHLQGFFTHTASNLIAVFLAIQVFCIAWLCVLEPTILTWVAISLIVLFILVELYLYSKVRMSTESLSELSYYVRKLRQSELMSQFYTRLKKAEHRVLLLDYDGTLAAFTVERNRAVPDDSVRCALLDLVRMTNTRVIIVSGRPVEEVKSLLGDDLRVEIWGDHGRTQYTPNGDERRFNDCPPDSEDLAAAAERLKAMVSNKWSGRLKLGDVELKTGAVAFHWRRLLEARKANGNTLRTFLNQLYINWLVSSIDKAIRKTFAPLVERGFELRGFDGGIELRCPGRNKGDVVRDILLEYEVEKLTVAYLGDDTTDEDAFHEIKGLGLSVLVKNTKVISSARVQISFPLGVAQFFARWNVVCCAARK
jgi:HAD superfamily hydrolase (TIGR01484 family)